MILNTREANKLFSSFLFIPVFVHVCVYVHVMCAREDVCAGMCTRVVIVLHDMYRIQSMQKLLFPSVEQAPYIFVGQTVFVCPPDCPTTVLSMHCVHMLLIHDIVLLSASTACIAHHNHVAS